MTGKTYAALLALLGTVGMAVAAQPPLHDSVALGIGFNCQWGQRCMASQRRSMIRALRYVRERRPPVWRIHLCNRNAARRGYRVDWIGFDNCIRNPALRPMQARAQGKRFKRFD